MRPIVLDMPPLRLDLTIDLALMVKVVRHGGMYLGRTELGMLAAHLVRRPSMRQVVHHDLRDADAGNPL